MRVWRIAKSEQAGSVEDMLSGEGAARYGGRWTPKGVPAVYCSENSSLAAQDRSSDVPIQQHQRGVCRTHDAEAVRANVFPSLREGGGVAYGQLFVRRQSPEGGVLSLSVF